jgi:hypothetical protein
MITAERLQTLTTFTPVALARGLELSGYKDVEFNTAEFLGITNGGQFCYRVTFYNDHIEEQDEGKVYLYYDQTMGSVKVDY